MSWFEVVYFPARGPVTTSRFSPLEVALSYVGRVQNAKKSGATEWTVARFAEARTNNNRNTVHTH